MKYTINNIAASISRLEIDDISKQEILDALDNAQRNLDKALSALNDVSVKGKENMDILLGCIIATETIMGIEQKGEYLWQTNQ